MVQGKATTADFSSVPKTNKSKKATPVRRASAAFRMCEGCGRPTPQQEASCTHCGKRHYHAPVIDATEHRERRFVVEFFERATPVAYGLFVLNLTLYVAMAAQAPGSFIHNFLQGVNEATLSHFGAASRTALGLGEWFRLFTSVFLHLSGLHLLSSSFALAIVGPQVERLYGSARFLVIYLLAGLGGTAGSLLSHQLRGQFDELAMGPSGATFGLFGVLAVFGLKYRKELPESFRQSFIVAVLPAILINLFIGFMVPYIDNAVTIGGLLAGVALTWLIPYLPTGRERSTRLNIALLAGCALVVMYCFGRAYFTNVHPKTPIQQAQLQH
jgi:rhomboid protease GluP